MALNTSHAPGGNVLIYNGEMILIYSSEVQLSFSGSDDVNLKGTKKGALYMTSHRIIFINKDQRDRLMSFCMPLHCIQGVRLEQPILSANYLQGDVVAQPGGNWQGQAVFKLVFHKGGCIEFGEALLNAVNLASRYQPYTSPPPYAPPAGGYFSAPPDYYTHQGNNYQGVNIPNAAFPEHPPPGSVQMFDTPPPYSGIGPNNPQQQNLSTSHFGHQPESTAPPSYQQNPPPRYEDLQKH